jgi:hypothetical protein
MLDKLVRLFIRILPDSILDSVNTYSLEELDERGLIVWANEVKQTEKEEV